MRPIALLTATLALALHLVAQAPAAPTQLQKPSPTDTVLQTGTQLIVVDVVVQDKDGHPIHGLKPSNFRLTEDKTAVTLHSFDEHTPAISPSTFPDKPKLPPGTFTNYTAMPSSGTLNILLLDTLNTPMADQSYVLSQLQEYAKHIPPGTHIAIFGLGTHLYLLQGFTSDPEVLKNVIDQKLLPRGSSLLDDPAGTNIDDPTGLQAVIDDAASTGGSIGAELAIKLAAFKAEQGSEQLQTRIQYTLDAFNTLGHYLSAFSGRKNLIWFSGSFPINILPDPGLSDPANPFFLGQSNEKEFRETTNLLERSQVAVYPIDARGLQTQPINDASRSGAGIAQNPIKFGQPLTSFRQSQFDEHQTMQQLADDTGGSAFYNTNGLTAAVTKAIDAGASYYTLTYSPPNHDWNGKFRAVHVNLTDVPSSIKLAYRRGYYADDPNHLGKNQTAASISAADSNLSHQSSKYVLAAMSRGAPEPQDILFKVRVLRESTSSESTPADGNRLDPHAPLKGPFQRLALDFASLPRDVAFTEQPDGNRSGLLEYVVYVYDAEGKLLNEDVRAIKMTNLTPGTYAKFLHSALQMHLDISVPHKAATYLRIGLHDVTSNRIGVLEIPVASISRLPPLSTPSTPSAAPSPTSPTPH